jgi:hypothetical protein
MIESRVEISNHNKILSYTQFMRILRKFTQLIYIYIYIIIVNIISIDIKFNKPQ